MSETIGEDHREALHKHVDEFLGAFDKKWVPTFVKAFVMGFLVSWIEVTNTILRLPDYFRGFVNEFRAALSSNAQTKSPH